MKGMQQPPWLAALQALNEGENPQQAVNEGDVTYPPAAGMEGIRHVIPSIIRHETLLSGYARRNSRTNPKEV